MAAPSHAASPSSKALALVSFTAGLVSPLVFALSWLITYSPLALQAYPTLTLIVDGYLAIVGVGAALCAVVVGIIALVVNTRSPRGPSYLGFAIAGVVLGALDGIGLFVLLAVALALFASLA
jgi:hypothetical protein